MPDKSAMFPRQHDHLKISIVSLFVEAVCFMSVAVVTGEVPAGAGEAEGGVGESSEGGGRGGEEVSRGGGCMFTL